MKKEILKDYIDACELVKETEQDIQKLKKRKKATVQDNVKGSMQDFPYAATHFHIEGTAYTYSDDTKLRIEEKLLEERKANAEKTKADIEKWMNTIPARMQRIIRYKFFEGLSWEQAADRMGKKSTGDSLRMEFNRFMK